MFFKKRNKVVDIYQPVSGQIIAIEQVDDPVFSGKIMGEGFAVIPNNGSIYSPLEGTVESVFPTKHALMIKTNTGLNALIHIGIDTVSLNGKGFEVLVKAGQNVDRLSQLFKVDLAILAEEKLQNTVIVAFPETDIKKIEIDVKSEECNQWIGKITL